MKTLKNLLIGISMLGLVGCNSEETTFKQDYSFDVSGLEVWQQDLFKQAKNYWNIQVEGNTNRAYLGTPQNADADAEAHLYSDRGDEIVFRTVPQVCIWFLGCANTKWSDCAKENIGVDFLEVSEHELGHVLGYGHSTDLNNVMYPIAKTCNGNQSGGN